MGRTLTEQLVLKKLDIADFRHLTKDKVIAMASMLDKMTPEVAKKALEQFPEFASTVKEILIEYKETLNKGLESNQESVQSYYKICNDVIESLQKELNHDNPSFEERKYIIDKMLEISKMMGEKDTENKKFIVTMAGITATALCFTFAVLASVLGGNTEIETNDTNNLS